MVRNEKKLRIVLLVYCLTFHNWWLKIRLQSMVRNNVLNECKVFSIRAEILSIGFSKFGSEQSNVVCECKSISSHSWLIFKTLSSTRTPNSTQPKSKRDTPRTRVMFENMDPKIVCPLNVGIISVGKNENEAVWKLCLTQPFIIYVTGASFTRNNVVFNFM